jgi:hypothetical protein
MQPGQAVLPPGAAGSRRWPCALRIAGRIYDKPSSTAHLIAIPIGMLNELNQFIIPLLLHAGTFTSDQLHMLMSLFIDLHDIGTRLDEILWGSWLLPMGYLVFNSGFLPKILGIVLAIVCLGYLVQELSAFLFPNSGLNVIAYTGWGELIFPFWLAIRGVNIGRWQRRVREQRQH